MSADEVVRVELDWPAQNTVTIGEDQYFGLERDGTVHLLSNRCPHRGGPLQLGEVADGQLRCPWHGNTFRLDRLCDRAIPSVQYGHHVVAYVPGSGAAEASHTLVFAKGDNS